jgi:hypothetical protein
VSGPPPGPPARGLQGRQKGGAGGGGGHRGLAARVSPARLLIERSPSSPQRGSRNWHGGRREREYAQRHDSRRVRHRQLTSLMSGAQKIDAAMPCVARQHVITCQLASCYHYAQLLSSQRPHLIVQAAIFVADRRTYELPECAIEGRRLKVVTRNVLTGVQHKRRTHTTQSLPAPKQLGPAASPAARSISALDRPTWRRRWGKDVGQPVDV